MSDSEERVSAPNYELMDDLDRRWQRGVRLPVEAYLEELAEHPGGETVLDLLATEVKARQRLGETPQLEEFQQRFPPLSHPLAEMWQVFEWFDPPTIQPGTRVSGYEVVEKLGEGAMGVVYRARQISLDRMVALKMIRPNVLSGERLARFKQEAEALGRLQHPHIVQVFDGGGTRR